MQRVLQQVNARSDAIPQPSTEERVQTTEVLRFKMSGCRPAVVSVMPLIDNNRQSERVTLEISEPQIGPSHTTVFVKTEGSACLDESMGG